MNVLTASELLSVWEKGLGSTLAARALLLLSSAFPDDLLPGQLPIGERDARLLALRERMFGSTMPCVTACPACNEKLELQLAVSDLLAKRDRASPDPIHLMHEGLALTARMPNSDDLMTLVQSEPNVANGRRLFERCLLDAADEHGPVASEDVPHATIEAIGRIMSESDMVADVQIHLDCPCCARSWDAAFDITTYLWNEIDTWAHHVLRDVHLIAKEYGWREHEILSLSPQRRQHYLDMIAVE